MIDTQDEELYNEHLEVCLGDEEGEALPDYGPNEDPLNLNNAQATRLI